MRTFQRDQDSQEALNNKGIVYKMRAIEENGTILVKAEEIFVNVAVNIKTTADFEEMMMTLIKARIHQVDFINGKRPREEADVEQQALDIRHFIKACFQD